MSDLELVIINEEDGSEISLTQTKNKELEIAVVSDWDNSTTPINKEDALAIMRHFVKVFKLSDYEIGGLQGGEL